MIPDVSHVFVYGTLKRGELRERSWPRPPLAVETATIRGALYDLGAYPALVWGEDLVEGELWSFAQTDLQATLSALDRIEGYSGSRDDLYHRDMIDCQARDGCMRAWVYWYARIEELRPEQRIAANRRGVVVWSRHSTS